MTLSIYLSLFTHVKTGEVLLMPFWSAKHSTRTVAVLSCQARTVRGLGPDGLRPGTGATVSCLIAGWSAPLGRMVRVCAGAAEVRRRRLDLALGGTPSGRRDPRSCLGSGRLT
jgi:hypothetical protein